VMTVVIVSSCAAREAVLAKDLKFLSR
jgi:hypothetical protein